MEALEVGERDDPKAVARAMEAELGVPEWWTPLKTRRPEPVKPRTTEDGLKVPAWWSDDETESQQWLLSQGVVL